MTTPSNVERPLGIAGRVALPRVLAVGIDLAVLRERLVAAVEGTVEPAGTDPRIRGAGR